MEHNPGVCVCVCVGGTCFCNRLWSQKNWTDWGMEERQWAREGAGEAGRVDVTSPAVVWHHCTGDRKCRSYWAGRENGVTSDLCLGRIAFHLDKPEWDPLYYCLSLSSPFFSCYVIRDIMLSLPCVFSSRLLSDYLHLILSVCPPQGLTHTDVCPPSTHTAHTHTLPVIHYVRHAQENRHSFTQTCDLILKQTHVCTDHT